jgi:ribosomal subunit interface protein
MPIKVKISFHNMEHSAPLEVHAKEKLTKIEEMFHDKEKIDPFYVELFLNSNKLHPHHSAELHLKTQAFDLNTSKEGTDMYVVVDMIIDKMVGLIKKEKTKLREKTRKAGTEKKEFIASEDKYTLGD